MRLIIDTDTAGDDAFSILLALKAPHVTLEGITICNGNVPFDQQAENALYTLEVAGAGGTVPVWKGCPLPMLRKPIDATEFFGADGMSDADFPQAQQRPEDGHAVDFLIDTIMSNPGEIEILAQAPLTNIATVIERAPDVVSRIREIVLMGGGFFEGGNITPSAEFNIFVDPEAAKIVFGSGVALTMLPLDVTHKVLTTKERVGRLRANGNRPSVAMADMLEFFERFDEEKYGTDGGPLHDPTVIAWLIDPGMFSGRACNVEIETGSDLTLGATVVDWWKVTNRAENAFVVRDVDDDRFFDLFIERVGRL